MPIQIKAPDGSIAQFPDGMPDAQIEAVMAKEYPQPSISDRIVASPVGRFVNDAIVAPARGLFHAAENAVPLVAGMMNPSMAAGQVINTAPVMGLKPMTDRSANEANQRYQASLARNRNTPGYAAARSSADARAQQLGSGGFSDQMLAPLMPSLAGIAGIPGGFDAMNANSDAQAAAQENYSANNPKTALAANVLGGFMAVPQGAAGRVPAQALPRTSAVKPFAQQAHDAGYTLTPRMISDKPGAVSDTLAGWSGKVKTAQSASAKNQEVTNALTAKSIGLPEDTVLTEQVLNDVRKKASQSYGAIPKALPKVEVDPDFYAAVNKLGEKSSAAAGEFPELLENPEIDKLVKSLSGKTEFSTDAGIALVRKLRKDSSTNFKSLGDPAKADLAFAQRDAANAIDDLIERRLDLSGNGKLSAEYKKARQTIAKTHDIEAAANTTTGNVSAKKIAALANRGRPLSGELKTIADTTNAFPKAMQSEAAFGEVEPVSVLDMTVSAVSAAHGNPGVGAFLLGRPAARGAVLSKPMQARMFEKAARGRASGILQTPTLPGPSAVPYGLLGSGALMPRNQ